MAPDFQLVEPRTGKRRTLHELKGEKGTVIVFMCNHCPYVKHILDGLIEVANQYIPRGVAFIGINSNDPTQYPEDAPEQMAKVALQKNFPFPYLFDETQEVARAYQAECTPEFFVFDSQLKCVYHGRFDDSRPGSGIPVTGRDLRAVLDALLEGKEVPVSQYPALGCSIKWRKG